MNLTRPLISRLCPLADLLLTLAIAYNATTTTNIISRFFGWELVPRLSSVIQYPFFIFISLIAVPLVLHHLGFYRRANLQPISRALQQICYFTAYGLSVALIFQSIHTTHIYVDRVIFITHILIDIAIFLRYIVVRWLQINTRLGQQNLNQILLLGTEKEMEEGWKNLSAEWKQGRSSTPLRAIIEKTNVKEIQELIENNSVESAFIFGHEFNHDKTRELMSVIGSQGIDINILLGGKKGLYTRTRLESVGNSQLLTLSTAPDHTWTYIAKGVIDRILALIILLCSLPLWIIAAIGIKISDPAGKIFYQQQRSGLFGKPFGMWKFRSMYSDADQRLDEIKAKYGNEMDGPIFKLTDDPRIFGFGHFIRKTSIDELPQLLNIIMGDMSIVGPRPLPVYETAEFSDPSHRRRLSVKPGLTCYWQVEDRSSTTDFNTMIAKDLKYIDNWSLWLDVTLFLRTIPAVLLRRGAK
ncbi:MAG: exopolysaccharide biosynthesis polyprenyl glycosylphosphotransferase [Akkermansia sp.]